MDDHHQQEPAIDLNKDLKISELKIKLEKVDAKQLENSQLPDDLNDEVKNELQHNRLDSPETDANNDPTKLNGVENGKSENDQPDQTPPSQTNGQAASPTIDQQEIKLEEEQPADADENKENCEDHVNFAVICSFFQQFGAQIGVNYSIETLKEMLEGPNKKLEENLIELNIKLLRKTRKYVNRERWEQGLVKFLYESSQVADALELESTGYLKSSLRFKIDLLKCLLEAQFDYNQKFKTEINNIETLLLRLVPIGRDSNGNQYWYHLDEEHTLRIYREQPDADRGWKLICQNKDEFTQLIDDVEHEKTEMCVLGVTASDENTDNEEEKTPKKKKKSTKKGKRRGKKGAKNKKLVNGHSKEDLSKDKELEASDKQAVDKDLAVSIKKEASDTKLTISIKLEDSRPDYRPKAEEQQPVKEERRRGRKPLNRSLFTTVSQKQSASTESSVRTDEDIEQIVQQTIRSLLDQIEQPDRDEPAAIAPASSVAAPSDCVVRNDEPRSEPQEDTPAKGKRSRKKKNPLGELSRLLGDNAPANVEDLMPVKRSSRIQKLQEKKEAELKVQMELEQKRLEELSKLKEESKKKVFEQRSDSEEEEAPHKSDSDESFKGPIKPRKKHNRSSETEEETVSNKKKKKRSRKKDKEREKQLKKFKKNCSDDELFYAYEEEEEEEILVFEDKEDEFACEELEEDDEPVVLKRARTARKAKTEDNGDLDDECVNDDTPCQKCDLYTNPEWILLCDHCDLGYHTECLTPKLYLIPDGDWYCPKCENEQLLTKLRFEFENYVSNLAKREREQLRKERLKYVEINIGNILTEESTSRKSKTNKKKYEDYVSDIDDSELDDDVDDNDSSVEFDSDNSETYNRRKASSVSRRRNNGGAYGRRRPAVQQRKVSRPLQKRKRRRSYTDESGTNSSSNSNLSSQEDDQDSNSSDSSLPKQRSARKKVSYQFKEYDDLIDSAIRASDYEDEYAENDEELEDEEEDSDDGKSLYSKGKDISNLMSMAAENPFQSDNDEEKKKADEPVAVTAVSQVTEEPSKEKPNESANVDEDERKVIVSEQKGKQRSKRKLNDLDSPIEEAENDSDFTIKDESLTELEEDTEMDEVESSDISNVSEDDTDLSDWARNTRKRITRSGGRRHKSKRSKKRRRYDSSDESDYGYKTRRRAKRVTYKEMSTSEDDDLDDDYSDNSEKISKKKKKDGKKKKKISSDDEFSEGQSDEDERTVLKKSKRTQKKKVYDDFTDLDESEEEQQEKVVNADAEEETNDQQIPAENKALGESVEGLPRVEITQVELPNVDQQDAAEAPAKKASKVKIKITKPNPKLAKNKNASSAEQPPASVNSLEVFPGAQSALLPNSSDLFAISQLENSQLAIPIEPTLPSDVGQKKKRNRAPKKPKETAADPSTPVPVPEPAQAPTPAPAKRSRKSKSSAGKGPVDVNAANLIPPAALNNSSVLSQLTQFANDAKLDQMNSKLLPNAPFAAALDPANFKQFLNSAVPNAQQQLNDLTMKHLPFPGALLNHSQSEIIARQATLASSKTDKKSPKEPKSSKRSKQSGDKTAASVVPTTAAQTVPKTAASLPVSTSSVSTTKPTANSVTNTAMSHIPPNVSLNHPQIPHFPTPQSIHGTSLSASRQMPPSHPMPSHLNPALLGAQPMQPPPNALPPNYPTHHLPPTHSMPPHALHNPYYPPPGTHPQPTPNQLAAAAAQHHPGLPPQLSHLANHPQFGNRFQNGPPNPLAGYPFPPYPDAAFAYYHQMNNPYYNYPNQPHHHPAYSLPGQLPGQHHPSQIAPPPNLAPPHPQPLPNSSQAATSVHTSHNSSTSQTNPKTTTS